MRLSISFTFTDATNQYLHGARAGVLPSGRLTENAQQLGMTLLLAAFECTGTANRTLTATGANSAVIGALSSTEKSVDLRKAPAGDSPLGGEMSEGQRGRAVPLPAKY